MKKLITTVQIFCLVICKLSSQNITIVYEGIKTRELDEVMKIIPEFIGNDIRWHSSLTIDKGISKYSLDSLIVVSLSNMENTGIFCFEDIYKNYNKDVWIRSSGRFKKGYGMVKKLSQLKVSNSNNYHWKISQEKKVIAGMECIKAVSTDGAIAWFAPKLPYPDGPTYGVFNLPGVVLSLEESNLLWEAKRIFIDNKKIQIPDLQLVENDIEIKISYDAMRTLGPETAIIVDKSTPTKKWITFKK